MNSIRFHAVLLLAMLALALPASSHGQSADLRVLQVEFENLLSEKVTDVYNAGLAKLDASYLAGVERGLTDAKAAGDLKNALSLQEEVKRLTDKEALPADDDQAAPALKKLRGVYRAELVKLDDQRVANRAALLTPYVAKMKQLEADLTKADRLAEAKAVMDYRKEFIAAGVPMKAAVAPHLTADVLVAKKWTITFPKESPQIWQFSPNFTMESNTGFKASWTIRNDVLRIDAGKLWNEFSLDSEQTGAGLVFCELNSSKGKRPGVILTSSASASDSKDDIPAGALVIEALIDGPSELRVTKSGIYWINTRNAKPGRLGGVNEPTYVNSERWKPAWKRSQKDRGDDTSAVHPVFLKADPEKLDFKLLAVSQEHDGAGIEKRDPIQVKVLGQELSILITDSQVGARWYKFALFPKKN